MTQNDLLTLAIRQARTLAYQLNHAKVLAYVEELEAQLPNLITTDEQTQALMELSRVIKKMLEDVDPTNASRIHS
ncbi:hypothetical protein [Deinococcus hopiensis]|uniref:Uncharacterized protein n=1 Tax=Deinococcus hopiensis KR-140 TaxID=695939 RepID=A0A1W1UW93_9DEIO|nr:hypothetical protein [Deinococcus hopiensis]SMB85435.1 hypothetical protein SAMN00790413_03402 [Deinococcus hopiensis KR-140]